MPADLNDYFKKRGHVPNKDPDDDGEDSKNEDSKNENNKKPFLKKGGGEPPQFLQDLGRKAGPLYVVAAIILIFFLTKPFVIINSGEMGIKATAGKYDSNPLQPGFHFFIPVLQKVIIVDTKVRIINYSATENDDPSGMFQRMASGIKTNTAISVLDERGLPVSIDLTVQYKLKAETAPQTIATYGLSWEDKIINPVVRDVVRGVTGQYVAEDLPTKRNEIALKIEDGIRAKIDTVSGQPVELMTVQLREIILPAKIKEQIERVQIAKQEAQRTKYEVERATQEAEKKAALARGDAEARKIQAQGQADAIKIEADADAYANREVGKSLNGELLKLRQIEVQGKFNDALRENKDAKIFLTPGGATPNIWLDTKDKQLSSSVSAQNQEK